MTVSERESATRLVPSHWRKVSPVNLDDIVFLGKATIKQMIAFWQEHSDDLDTQVIENRIALLYILLVRAEEKPVLAAHRPHDWFSIGESVVRYAGGAFLEGTITDGYRHHDGKVTISHGAAPDRSVSMGLCRPDVLKTWEFEYLLANEYFVTSWVQRSIEGKLRGFELLAFLDALHRVRVERQSRRC